MDRDHFVRVAADDDDSHIDQHENPFATRVLEATLSEMLLKVAR